MPKYILQWDYKAGSVGPYMQGDVIEIEKELADWMNRDSPGVLILVKDAKGPMNEVRSLKRTPKDRMVKKAEADRVQDNFGTMSKADFKAVKGE